MSPLPPPGDTSPDFKSCQSVSTAQERTFSPDSVLKSLLINRLKGQHQGSGLYLLANRLTAAGRNGEALDIVAQAVKQKAPWAPYVAVDPGFLPLFELESFQNMVAEMGLPVKFRRGHFVYRPEL